MSIDLDAIQAYTDAATEGPWFVEASGQGRERLHIIDAIVRDPYGDNSLSLGNDAATAEFIAHARTDVPALLAYARDLEARNKKAKADAWDAALTAEGYSETGLAAVFADNPYRAALTATEES